MSPVTYALILWAATTLLIQVAPLREMEHEFQFIKDHYRKRQQAANLTFILATILGITPFGIIPLVIVFLLQLWEGPYPAFR